MKKIALYILTPILSYLSGFIAFSLAFFTTAQESIGGEAVWLLTVSGLTFLFIGFPVYLGIIHWIDSKYNTFKGLLYPMGCMLVFFIPTLAINLRYGSINLLAPESMLFHLFFIVTGAVFGLCHWAIKQERVPHALAYSFIAIGILASLTWLGMEKYHSYATPENAFAAVEGDVIAIPGYSDFFGRELRYFFVKEGCLGVAYAERAPFGWKAEGISWSNLEPPANYARLHEYGFDAENLIYGFVKLEPLSDYTVAMEGAESNIIHPLLPEEVSKAFHLQDVYIWYASKEELIKEGEVELVDKRTGEVIDTLVF
ncbi:hypothetical protein AB1K83_03780 [Sporosarcina sp. 179-K 3D1 HS]|uniref:hypothetical protein n=1 Tax=Sporosarcina sp. 179-K 3D1 HS TaxID=3232169 RepID=UPI00399F8D3B